MLKLQHENIVRLKEVFETDVSIYVVMEHVNGEELFKRLADLPFYTEQIVAHYFRQITNGIRYLHEYGIVHRNLKASLYCENILLSSSRPEAVVKIADAGLNLFVLEDMDVELVCCNTIYCPPELLLSRKFDKTFDMWSLGLILYIILSGSDPFYPKTDEDLFRAVLLGEIQYSNEAWDQVSLNGKDAVKRLLVVDPQQRALTTDILQHPWVKGDHATTEHLVVGQRRLGEFNIRRAALNAKFAERRQNTPTIPQYIVRCNRKYLPHETVA
ncbi:Calcium/calmodulin-dependent protein kinase type IV [Fasciolopsis buskii]|uniref:Calcium/calmodulin-dependent protein kinase type IV n=1 Tax=Fasciolopsis buskii TaxID=27845 RepID=A0A8E0RPF1_9TREM|nr:Calcium/calmodulin-dependent protein kinase type IV [Fasciolopsis buski]